MAIQFSTMTNWLSIFEGTDNTRSHTLVSSPYTAKIYQKLYAGANFTKNIDSFFIELEDAPTLSTANTSREYLDEGSPLLLPFEDSEHWYSHAMLPLEQYFSELHGVPATIVNRIAKVLNTVNLPDYHTLQMMDIELSYEPWKWHALRSTAYPSVMVLKRHALVSLQIFFILLQLWVERLSRKGELKSTLVFLPDQAIANSMTQSEAWRFLLPRLLSLNIYLVLPQFEYSALKLSAIPLRLESTPTTSATLAQPGFGIQ